MSFKFCGSCGGPLPAPGSDKGGPPTLASRIFQIDEKHPLSLVEALKKQREEQTRVVTVVVLDSSSPPPPPEEEEEDVRDTRGNRDDRGRDDRGRDDRGRSEGRRRDRDEKRSRERPERKEPEPKEPAKDFLGDLFTEMESVVGRHGGLAGRGPKDSVLFVFGLLGSHENHAERALAAAVEMREAARRIDLDICAGINTGELTFGRSQLDGAKQDTLTGLVIEFAGFLRSKAEMGHLICSYPTFRFGRRAFQLSPISIASEHEGETAEAFMVEYALQEALGAAVGLGAELVGRDESVGCFRELADGLAAGKGHAIFVSGEPGLGKSRLLAEWRQHLAQRKREAARAATTPAAPAFSFMPAGMAAPAAATVRDPLWMDGRIFGTGCRRPFEPFVAALERYFGLSADSSTKARAQRLTVTLQELVANGHLPADRHAEIAPLLGDLMFASSDVTGGDSPGRTEGSRIDASNIPTDQRRQLAIIAIRDLFVALLRQQPIVIALDDFDSSDSLSLEVASHLVELVRTSPLILVAAGRSSAEGRFTSLLGVGTRRIPDRCTHIELAPLNAAQALRMVSSLPMADGIPDPVRDRIVRMSAGSPLALEEYLRVLLAARLLYEEGGVWRVKPEIDSWQPSETLSFAVNERMETLAPDLQELLRFGAAAGERFMVEIVEGGRQDPVGLRRRLGALCQADWLTREPPDAGGGYVFKHPLEWEAVYESIPSSKGLKLHADIAAAILLMDTSSRLPANVRLESLAYHFDRAGDSASSDKFHLAAAEADRLAGLYEEAALHFQRMLDRLPPDPTSARVEKLAALEGLGQILMVSARHREAEALYRQAVALLGDAGSPVERALLYWRFAESIAAQSGRLDEVAQVAERGMQMLPEGDESAATALLTGLLAVVARGKGQVDRWREMNNRCAEALPKVAYTADLKTATINVALMRRQERNVAGALEWLDAALERANAVGDLRGAAEMRYTRAEMLRATGKLREAVDDFQAASSVARQTGDQKLEAPVLSGMTETSLLLGDLPTAEESARTLLQEAQSSDWKMGMARPLQWLAEIALCTGNEEEAAESLRQATQLYRSAGDAWSRFYFGMASLTLARAALARGDRRGAGRVFQETLVHFISQPPPPLYAARLFSMVFGGLEEAYESPDDFRALCRKVRMEAGERGILSYVRSLTQWYLEPGNPFDFPTVQYIDRFSGSLLSAWTWSDPFGDCAYTVKGGLEINCVNGRDLRMVSPENMSAPRLLRSVSADFAVEAVCSPLPGDRPAQGGVLLWQDADNFIQLDRGTRGKREIVFRGWLGGKELLFGRGRLPSERMFLRLERVGRLLQALCSAEGKRWTKVGHVDFLPPVPLQIGVYAIGDIDRTIYHGAYPDGTAVRFESFQAWG